MNFIDKFFRAGSTPAPVSENDTFITLMQLAREDRDIRSRLELILKLDSFNRRSLLNSILSAMSYEDPPDGLMESLEALKDDEVARHGLEFFKKEGLVGSNVMIPSGPKV